MGIIDSMFDRFFASKTLDRIFTPFERAMDSDNFLPVMTKILTALLILAYVVSWITVAMMFVGGYQFTAVIIGAILSIAYFGARYTRRYILTDD